LAVLVFCGYGAYVFAPDDGADAAAADQPAAATVLRELTSRADDPRPLTAHEVFPDPRVVVGLSGSAYPVLRVQVLADCAEAAAGGVGPLLAAAGCSQVVRATLRSPDAAYVATAGLVNLADAAGAQAVHERIKPLVDAGTGRFRGMPAGPGTDGLAHDTAQLGWHVRGHFVAYAVIARTDGGRIWVDDPVARQILSDLIELHLRARVLDRRASIR